MAKITVTASALADTDGRYARLALLLELADADHARAKMEHLWAACTDRGETDLPAWVIAHHLGPRGPEALIAAELGRSVGGRGDSDTRRIYIRGSKEHTTWYSKIKGQSPNAGKVRAQNASRVAGRFTSKVAGDDTSVLVPVLASVPVLINPPSEDKESAPRCEPEARPSAAAPEIPVKRKPGRPKLEGDPSERRKVTDAFNAYFAEKHPGSKPTWVGRPVKELSTLMAAHPVDEILKRLEILRLSPPTFPPQPWDFVTFTQHFDKCASPSTKQPHRGPPHRDVRNADLLEHQLARVAELEAEEARRAQQTQPQFQLETEDA